MSNGSPVRALNNRQTDRHMDAHTDRTDFIPSNADAGGNNLYLHLLADYDNSGLSAGTPVDKKRQNYIQELIDTEEQYVADLSIVMQVIHGPNSETPSLTFGPYIAWRSSSRGCKA